MAMCTEKIESKISQLNNDHRGNKIVNARYERSQKSKK